MTYLILIGGLAAAGKTTLGREIARITKFAYLDKDTMTQPLVEALLTAANAPGGADDRQSDIYLRQVRPLEYAAFLNTVGENVLLDLSTIAVAPFLREMSNNKWLDELQQQLPTAVIHQVWLDTSDDVLHQRIASRNSPRDREKLKNWADYINASRKITPCNSCVVIDSYGGEDATSLAMRTLRMLGIST